MLYLTAASTGFRVGELAALEPFHFHLDADPPVVALPRALTKNGKDAVQPLPLTVVSRLRPLIVAAVGKLWPGTWCERAAIMFRIDLAATNIPVETSDGEAVFHSLRHTYDTMFGRSAPIKVVQELARHSTPVLTIGRYGYTDMEEKAEAVAKLPLPGMSDSSPFTHLTRPELERYAATVTALTGAILDTRQDAQKLEPIGDSGRRSGTEIGKTGKGKRRLAA